MSTLSATIAELAASPDVPDEVLERTGHLLAAVATRASSRGLPAPLAAALDDTSPVVAPLGSRSRRSVPDAALVTAAIAAVDERDDTRRSAVAVVAAVAAVAEHRSLDGRRSLEAMAVGVEISVRLAEMMRGSGYWARGWDIAGLAGSVGGAAGVAAAIGAPPTVTAQAIGIAATQAAGLRLASEPLQAWLVGKAAANGVESTLLCAQGFSGPTDGLEGRRGLFAVAAPEVEPSVAVEELGSRWRMMDMGSAKVGPSAELAAEAAQLTSSADFATFAHAARS